MSEGIKGRLIGKLFSSGILFLATVAVISIVLQNGSAEKTAQTPEDLYNECEGVAGKSLCDFLFKKNDLQPLNDTSTNTSGILNLSPSNYTLSNSNLTYNDKELGFSIQYPSDWSINDQYSQYYTVIRFESPDGPAVDVRVIPKGDYKSLKEYGDKNFKNFEDQTQTLLGYYRNSSTLLSGKPAFRAIYLTTYNPSLFENAFGYKSSTFKAMYTATMVPEKKSVFAIAYFASPNNFDNYLSVIEKMISSFKIYGKGPIIQEDNSSSSSP